MDMDCYDTSQCQGDCVECRYWLTKNRIETEEAYNDAMTQIETLMDKDPEPDTPDGDSLRNLVVLVEEYERRHFPMECGD